MKKVLSKLFGNQDVVKTTYVLKTWDRKGSKVEFTFAEDELSEARKTASDLLGQNKIIMKRLYKVQEIV